MPTRPSSTWNGLIELRATTKVNDAEYDGVLVVSENVAALQQHPLLKDLHQPVEDFSKLHKSLEKGGASLIVHQGLPFKRLVYAATGSVTTDFDDVRKFLDAGIAAGKCALSIGLKSPLFVVVPSTHFPNSQLLGLIGLLHSFYVPLNVRESEPNNAKRVSQIGVLANLDPKDPKSIEFLKLANAFQSSFSVCRDVGDSDPVRMAPPKVAEYIKEVFRNTCVTVKVESDPKVIEKEYPLVHAVNRSANDVESHRARLIWLEYVNEETLGTAQDFETLMMVGKGVTIDTGGADLKAGGAMFGMSRDKYGSAVVGGFFQALSVLRPKGIKVIGNMCMVRNSIGSNSYTCDEIITARSGKRIHIYNTDAEGRIAMLEPLTQFTEQALKEKNPHLMTIATLTGHCVLSYLNYPAIMDNGPAKASSYGPHLQKTGDSYGQPVEISRLHNEDFSFHSAECDGADLRQANTKPSVQTPRGHMTPAGFLIRGSRLDEHGLDSEHPLKYTHIDIGSAMGMYPATTFPCPLLALVAHHILPRLD